MNKNKDLNRSDQYQAFFFAVCAWCRVDSQYMNESHKQEHACVPAYRNSLGHTTGLQEGKISKWG